MLTYYLPCAFIPKDNNYLVNRFRSLTTLLFYHDPLLYKYFKDMDISPPLYAIPWFMTIYSDCLSLENTLHLWDVLLSLKNGLFPAYFGVAVLILQRKQIMSVYNFLYLV